jgi:Restriction endonuclease S subunits
MVPNGWIATQIGDVAKFSSGGTPSKQEVGYWGGGEPWISGKDLKTHYLERSIDTLTEEGFKVAKKAPYGATLILVRGMTLLKDFPVGFATREVAFNQDLKALVPVKGVDGLFLSFLLVAEKHKIRQLVSTAGHGTGRLETHSIQEYPINLPPLPEQKKIAQILSTWDKAITTTEKLLANSQQQKKALMEQLLTGKKRLLDKNGVRFSGEWKRVKLGNVFSKVSNGVTYDPQITEGLPVTRIETISTGVVNFDKVGLAPAEDNTRRFRLEKGDILYSHINSLDHIGRVAYFNDDRPLYHGMNLLLLRTEEPNQSMFLYYILDSSIGKRYAKSYAKSAVNQASISTTDIKTFSIHLPIKEEQQKIAQFLSVADRDISLLTEKLLALKNEKKALMQQLLTGKRRVKIN